MMIISIGFSAKEKVTTLLEPKKIHELLMSSPALFSAANKIVLWSLTSVPVAV